MLNRDQRSTPPACGSPAGEVRAMFESIAENYDLTNTVLSLGMHHWWRRSLVREIALPPQAKVLDLCTGTGDLLPLLRSRCSEVVGIDFSRRMLLGARTKLARRRVRGPGTVTLAQGDALALPFSDGSFDLVSVAFGVRNFEDLRRGLAEIRRVLTRDGRLAVLEFGQPPGRFFGAVFKSYSKYGIPIVGGALSGNRAAYHYLPQTSSDFPCGAAFAAVLAECGFETEKFWPVTGGIAYCYHARRAEGEKIFASASLQ